MGKSFYDVLCDWTENEWDVVKYYDVMTEVANQVGNAGHIDNPLGSALSDLRDWFDEMCSGWGIIMSDEEQQSELKGKLNSIELKLMNQVEVDITLSPDIKVIITNIEQLKKTGDPEAVKRVKSDLHKMFEDLSFGGGK